MSTDEVYGDVEAPDRCTESAPLRPSSPYSASKAGGDMQVLAAVRTHGVDACITRGANTYGPNEYPEKIIPLFVTNAFDGLELPVYGDGRQVREWLHAEDHAAAVDLVLREGRAGEAYNVGGEERENLDVTQRIVELTGCDPALVRHVDDRPATTGATPSTTQSSARSAGRGRSLFDEGSGRDGRVVPGEPPLVGADQVRRVPRVLRAAVRLATNRRMITESEGEPFR